MAGLQLQYQQQTPLTSGTVSCTQLVEPFRGVNVSNVAIRLSAQPPPPVARRAANPISRSSSPGSGRTRVSSLQTTVAVPASPNSARQRSHSPIVPSPMTPRLMIPQSQSTPQKPASSLGGSASPGFAYQAHSQQVPSGLTAPFASSNSLPILGYGGFANRSMAVRSGPQTLQQRPASNLRASHAAAYVKNNIPFGTAAFPTKFRTTSVSPCRTAPQGVAPGSPRNVVQGVHHEADQAPPTARIAGAAALNDGFAAAAPFRGSPTYSMFCNGDFGESLPQDRLEYQDRPTYPPLQNQCYEVQAFTTMASPVSPVNPMDMRSEVQGATTKATSPTSPVSPMSVGIATPILTQQFPYGVALSEQIAQAEKRQEDFNLTLDHLMRKFESLSKTVEQSMVDPDSGASMAPPVEIISLSPSSSEILDKSDPFTEHDSGSKLRDWLKSRELQ